MGFLFIVLSAVGFGSMALFGHIAYRDNVDTCTLLLLRFSMAAGVMMLMALVTRARFPQGQSLLRHILMGVIYTGMAWAYFSALKYAASSTVAMVLYTYPILVSLTAFSLGLDRFGVSEAVALALSSLGLLLVLGGALEGSSTGFCLAFLAAVFYSAYILVGAPRQADDTHPIAASAVVLSTAALILWPITWSRGAHWPSSGASWGAVTTLALLGTALAISAFIEGLRRLGPTLSAVLSTLEPVITVFLGVLFLSEQLSSHTLIGGGLILLSAAGLSVQRARTAQPVAAAATTSPDRCRSDG